MHWEKVVIGGLVAGIIIDVVEGILEGVIPGPRGGKQCRPWGTRSRKREST
jgi:hypothetical protein